MEKINMEDYLNNGKTCEITMGKKRWVFKELPMKKFEELLKEANEENLMKAMMSEGDLKEFEEVYISMTYSSQRELTVRILTSLGLVSRLQKVGELSHE